MTTIIVTMHKPDGEVVQMERRSFRNQEKADAFEIACINHYHNFSNTVMMEVRKAGKRQSYEMID